MTIIKWIAILLVTVYCAGLVVLYRQAARDAVSDPARRRAPAPDAAGFPEAEEHVLTTSDGEKVIVWHVPAKPGRPVILYFPRQWRLSSPVASAASRP